MGVSATMQGTKGPGQAPVRCTWLLSASRAPYQATSLAPEIHPGTADRGLENDTVTSAPCGPELCLE